MTKAYSPKSKSHASLIASAFAIAILALGSLSIIAVPAYAIPSVKLATMPSCGSSVSQSVYDSANAVVWQICYLNGVLWKEDFSTNPPTMTSYATGGVMGSANPIGLCQDSGNLYAPGRQAPRELFKIPKASPASISVLASGLGSGDLLYPTCFNGFVYVPIDSGIAKVDMTSGAVTNISTGTQMSACTNDGSVVLCDSISGNLYEINPSTNAITLRVSGLGTPVGLFATASYVYIAQDITGGSVVQISRTTWTTLASGGVSSGTNDKPYWVTQIGSYLVVSTEGIGATTGNRNVYVYDPTTMASLAVIQSPVVEDGQVRPLFALASDGTNIFVAFQGSSGTGQISNWQASVPTSTTTTTVTISVTSETSSTSTSSTGSGGLASYAPQVIPTITLNSTGLAGQHNIYATRDNSITLTGFLWFSVGGSGGTFNSLGICQTTPECEQLGKSPSPSRGTFQSLTWTTPPTIEGPQPACSLIPYLSFCKSVASPIEVVQPSQTYYGVFCNNEKIVSKVADCIGHGRPINYQTFSITVSNLSSGWNVITLLATGTESHGETFKVNIFVFNG